jgi:hypothetical protein
LHQRGMKRCSEIDNRLAQQFVQLVFIDAHDVCPLT